MITNIEISHIQSKEKLFILEMNDKDLEQKKKEKTFDL